MWRSNARAPSTVSPKTSIIAWGIVPVASRPASDAPAGVAHEAQPPTRAAYSIRSDTAGCTWRAPKLTTGFPPAASTQARAAVAQPVPWASVPSIAVS